MTATTSPNPFTVSGDPGGRPRRDPLTLLSDEEQERIRADAAAWHVGLEASVARAGFASPSDYLEAQGAVPTRSRGRAA